MNRDAIKLSAATGLDPRTCAKALRLGAEALRSEGNRAAVRAAAKRLGLRLGARRRAQR